ncbi:MAG: type ISP restriction/modification enzyme [Lactococcus lactis]|nr:type ISP restriction/modification enzyme [Lactococcus cremoris]MDU7301015.1 type ISP restriction/modification enzyme [Lactococcus lactis]
MDDESKYGTVFYRLGFGDAISRDFLTDYKLMVLAVDEATIHRDMQRSLSDPENGLNVDDIGRIIGVWNGMLKRETDSNNVLGAPMKRAIAFSRTINDSKRLSNEFESVVNDYLSDNDDNHFTARVRHADGTMNALQKNEALDWLADESLPENEARILSNVRFLTEGIDVPSLDAIIFLSPRKSQVDIVQAVGRIIRKSPDKEYGYIILPIVIPTGVSPESILDNNKQYDVVWQVLNALRSVDERFEATINKLQLNKKKPENISVIGVGGAPDDEDGNWKNGGEGTESTSGQMSFDFEWAEIEGAIYGKIVQKVGDRRYLEDWSQDVAKIAQRHIDYTNELIKSNSDMAHEFSQFLKSLQHNINSSITQEQAVEMLAQHLITKPVFDALFNEYSVVRNNPVNDAMEKIVKKFSAFGFPKEQKELDAFYESVKLRASGIDNAEAKQQIIVTLYDKFFRTGFKETTERLGIVFTPVEVVDFIIHSVDDVLRKYFNKTIASKGVHILDPFTGTGTFITRTLQYLKGMMDRGEIQLEDILEKYVNELHANEIILLSYYIAAINIEAVFDEINGEELNYEPFEGIVLTDTFQSTETEDTLDDDFFGGNDERLKRQQEVPITVIMGNPPYSAKQNDANDDNANIKYPKLDEKIRREYVEHSNANLQNNLYDSYIRAFRWASDRLTGKGVIGFVSNGQFIDSLAADGLRYSLYNEFNHLYIFNLRGDQRTVGEQSRKEGGKIFGSGSRTPIAISILVKDGSDNHEVHYHDIGDYLNREQKLSILRESGTIENIEWSELVPDKNHDWINQRDENYDNFYSLDGEVFTDTAIGVKTNRDTWVFNFGKETVQLNSSRMIDNYLIELEKSKNSSYSPNLNPAVIKWSAALTAKLNKKEVIEFNKSNLIISQYRPFTKKWLYNGKDIIERPGRMQTLFSDKSVHNVLYSTGKGTKKDFSVLITNNLPEYMMMDNGQAFPLEILKINENTLFEDSTLNIKGFFEMSEEDSFCYVYGVLHSPEYKEKYSSDLKKALPRIPLLKNKEKFVEIGRKLADLHLNYEHQPSWEGVTVSGEDSGNFKVKKMKHPKKGQLDTIVFNESITVSNIPDQAYEYVVNGRSAIEWIIDQYQIKTDKKSGITDDPNEFAPENPRYILDLLLSVITVSMRTVELVAQLPEMEVVK